MSKVTPNETADLRIGDTVYTFDVNRRVYKRDASGHAKGGPIYREHFWPWKIVGEEKRSWLLSQYSDGKWPTKMGKGNPALLTERQVSDRCWIHDHRMCLARLVGDCRDASVLRAVANAIGYHEDAIAND